MRRRAGAGLPQRAQRRLALLGPRRGVGRGCLRGRVESAQRRLFGVKAESTPDAKYRPFAILVTPLKLVAFLLLKMGTQ